MNIARAKNLKEIFDSITSRLESDTAQSNGDFISSNSLENDLQSLALMVGDLDKPNNYVDFEWATNLIRTIGQTISLPG